MAPPDDDACPSVTCAANNPCQIAGQIDGNRCVSPGVCRTAADCSTQNAPARTACGPAEPTDVGNIVPICNATGVCTAPAVNCRGVTDTITPTNCCSLDFPDSLDPVGFVSSCLPGASGNITATCDNVSDCPLGSICCLNDNGNFNFIACSESCAESGSPNDPSGAGVYLVCSSPGGGNSPCPGGRACNRTHPELPDWTFCTLP